MLRLEHSATRGQDNEEHGVWEFVAIMAGERFAVLVSDRVLCRLFAISEDQLTHQQIMAGLNLIEAHVAVASDRRWPRILGVTKLHEPGH